MLIPQYQNFPNQNGGVISVGECDTPVLKFVLFLTCWVQPDWLIWLRDAGDAEHSVAVKILLPSPSGLNSCTTNWSWRWRHCFPPKTLPFCCIFIGYYKPLPSHEGDSVLQNGVEKGGEVPWLQSWLPDGNSQNSWPLGSWTLSHKLPECLDTQIHIMFVAIVMFKSENVIFRTVQFAVLKNWLLIA